MYLKRQKRFLGLCLLALLAVVVLTISGRYGVQESSLRSGELNSGSGPGLRQVVVNERLFQQHPVIYGGINVDKIYELDLNSRTFTADGSFWLEWPISVEQIMEKEQTRPIDLVILQNRIETWDSTFDVSTPESTELSSGRRYQLYHFSSRFYDDTISFKRDPFDLLSLPIVVELKQPYMSQKYADVRLLPQPRAGSLVDNALSLSGYELKDISWKGYVKSRLSRFGMWYSPSYAQLRMEMIFQSNIWPGLVNWILPLMIINSIALMAPSVEGSLADVRLAIPSTALLTLIFLQQSYHSSLPRLSYTTFLDDLFSCSYLISMGLFALFTWGHNTYSSAADDKKEQAMKVINKADLLFQVSSALLLVVVATFSWTVR